MNRYFLYDPGNGFETFRTIEERDAAAKEAIEYHLDDGWSEDVTQVCVGEVTGVATKANVRTKPKRSDFPNEEEYDDAIADWGGESMYDELCDYEIAPLTGNARHDI